MSLFDIYKPILVGVQACHKCTTRRIIIVVVVVVIVEECNNNNMEKSCNTLIIIIIIIIIIPNYKSWADWRNFWHNAKQGMRGRGRVIN